MAKADRNIPQNIIDKWQRIVDLTSKVVSVPATLVMKTDLPDHSVLVSSQTKNNPYVAGQSFELNDKLYCNSVLNSCDELIVRDAWNDKDWDDNQDLQHGMSFYIGYPLCWPDGRLFGTICVLDNKDNQDAVVQRELLKEFASAIESDLAFLEELRRRKNVQRQLQETLAGLEQRVENRTRKLEDANTALRVLITNLETSRHDFENQIVQQLNGLVLPHIERLKQCLGEQQPERSHVELVDANLKKITSPFANQLVHVFSNLTPTEIEIAQLVISGQTTKSIAKTLGRQTSTIDFHRNNIRKKLGIHARKVNLRSHLLSFQ